MIDTSGFAMSIVNKTIEGKRPEEEYAHLKMGCVDFINSFMLNPETGDSITVQPEPAAVLSEMTARDNGKLRYNTLLYSSIKKSAKTFYIGSMAHWWGWQVDNGRIYIIGNDLKQARSRMFEVIEYSCDHNPALTALTNVIGNYIYLDNGTIIEALPLDAAGEAGSNPTGIFWTEVWAAMHKKHRKMWTEMARSLTRSGYAMTVVESYAGYEGESTILEDVYVNGVEDSEERPDIAPEFYVNQRQASYWCTRRVMSWQIGQEADEYYADEAKRLSADEYLRIHHNQWISSEASFVTEAQWEACRGAIPPLGRFEDIVLSLDAGVSNDNFAAVMWSRVVDDESESVYYFRGLRLWQAPKGGEIDFDLVEDELVTMLKTMPIVMTVYDPYQLAQLSQNLRAKGYMLKKFDQGRARLEADSNLQKRIFQRRLVHDGNEELQDHILNAKAKMDIDERKLRMVKKNDKQKIDAGVATSMCIEILSKMNIG